jgi:molybdate transport system substrate-binding protein
MLIRILIALTHLILPPLVFADQIQVAVASNFVPTLRLLTAAFAEQSDHKLRISSASTGKLYAQIIHGAPYDLFLAADAARPARLEQANHTIRGSRFTYAQGRLVLWGPKINSTLPAETLLQSNKIRHISIANPTTAPYGAAARDVLQGMSLWEGLRSRLVRGGFCRLLSNPFRPDTKGLSMDRT